ncbi:MAG TPA: hypothetical protein VJL29_16285 [Thermoguttaceae bacterium]|nr:hypothetical protein [Thermoguttaceae bacterium]
MTIRFACSCGRQWAVGKEYAGKKTKCPDCGAGLTVPNGSPAAAAAPLPAEVAQPSASGPSASAPRGPCPACGKGLEEGQVVCLECGFHRLKRVRLRTERVKATTAIGDSAFERWIHSERVYNNLILFPVFMLVLVAAVPIVFLIAPLVYGWIGQGIFTGILNGILFCGLGLAPIGSLFGIVLGIFAVRRPRLRSRGWFCLLASSLAALIWLVEITPVALGVLWPSSGVPGQTGIARPAPLDPHDQQLRQEALAILNRDVRKKSGRDLKIEGFDSIGRQGDRLAVIGRILNRDGTPAGTYMGIFTIAETKTGLHEEYHVEYVFE